VIIDNQVARVTQIQAAHRQVDGAIRLHFAGADPVIVHSIAGNAANLLTDFSQHVRARSWDEMVREGVEIPTKVYFNVMRAGAYFLKHVHIGENGKLDRSAQFEFCAADNEAILFWAVQNIGIVDSISQVQGLFRLWYLAARVATLGPDYRDMHTATAAFPGLAAMDPLAQLSAGHSALTALEAP
jgi:hypothetical protein